MALNNKTHRLQITLPDDTVKLIDDIRKQGRFSSRSGFLNQAAQHYALRLKKAALKRKLRSGYLARAERDRALLSEWESASGELL